MKTYLFTLCCVMLGWAGRTNAEPHQAAPVTDEATELVALWWESPGSLIERSQSTLLRIGDELAEGAMVTVRQGELMLLWSSNGDLWRVQGPVELRVGESRPVLLHGDGTLSRERFDGYVEGRHLLPKEASSEPLMPQVPEIRSELVLVSPLSMVMRERSPRFRWYSERDSATFEVLLEQCEVGTGGCTLRERWRNLRTREFKPFAPLTRGARYRLTIREESEGPSHLVLTRVFEVLSVESLQTIDDSLASLGQMDAERPELEVLRARILESFGLWGEAVALWYGLSSRYPNRDEPLRQVTRLFSLSASYGEWVARD